MKRQLVIFSDYHTYHGGELIVGGWVDDSPISLAGGFVNNQASLNLTAIQLGSITLTTDYHFVCYGATGGMMYGAYFNDVTFAGLYASETAYEYYFTGSPHLSRVIIVIIRRLVL